MSKVCQLFSGSSGNSIYIATSGAKFLVDVGVSAKKIELALQNIDASPNEIDGIFITHEHIDHVRGVRVLASRHNIPVFAPKAVAQKLLADDVLNSTIDLFALEDLTSDLEINGAQISAFKLSHDSVDCVGYSFIMPDKRKISVCTDTGYVTDDAKNALLGTDLICLESNHEVTMLQNGPYPFYLKKRILSDNGHLSNVACSDFAVQLAKSGTTRFVLSHISKENNHPSIARETTYSALVQNGFAEHKDFKLFVSEPEHNERIVL